MDFANYNNIIKEFSQLIKEKRCNSYSGDLKVGIDLGTTNIVLAVTDNDNKPIAGIVHPSIAIRDGIVVDYLKAVEIVRKLKNEAEQMLGKNLEYASTAIPPGIIEASAKVITNVVEASDFIIANVIDEPTAASEFLEINDGAVIDIGGGTTGISIIKNGKVIYSGDEPTGGTHMTLVLAGSKKISFIEAEILKKDKTKENEIFPIVKPVVEKMISIVRKLMKGYKVNTIYLVGGACGFNGMENLFEKELGIKTIKPYDPMLVTPLGIAKSCIYR